MIKKFLALIMLVSVASTSYAVPGVATAQQSWNSAVKYGHVVWDKVCYHKYGTLITAAAIATVLTVYNVEGLRTKLFQLVGFDKKAKKRPIRRSKCKDVAEDEEKEEGAEGEEKPVTCQCELEGAEAE